MRNVTIFAIIISLLVIGACTFISVSGENNKATINTKDEGIVYEPTVGVDSDDDHQAKEKLEEKKGEDNAESIP